MIANIIYLAARMNSQISTLIGVSALIFWSTLVGMLRLSSDQFGPIYSVTYIYTLSAIILFLLYGLPDFNKSSKKFLLISSALFVTFELCFAFSITFATTSSKSIEMNIIFNLWPTIVIMILALLKEEKVNLLTIVGFIISFTGIIIINYNKNFNFIDNIIENPLSYFLIFLSCVLWAIYCIYTKKHSNGSNGISLYFILTAITLWVFTISTKGLDFQVLDISSYWVVLIAAVFLALGYLAWNIGIIKGDMPLLVMLSYFSPIMSSSFSSLVLHSNLSINFWYGTCIVILGSLVCWLSMRKNHPKTIQLST